jgi:hypothetical protein
MDSVFDPAALDETYLFIVVSNPLTLGCALWRPSPLDISGFPFEPTNASHPAPRTQKH